MAPAIHCREWGKVCRQELLFTGKFASMLPPNEVSFPSVHAFMQCAYVCDCMEMLTTASTRRSEDSLGWCLCLAPYLRGSVVHCCTFSTSCLTNFWGSSCLYLSSCSKIVLADVYYYIWLSEGFEAWNLGPHLWQLFQMLLERSCWVWKELIGALNLVSLGHFLESTGAWRRR